MWGKSPHCWDESFHSTLCPMSYDVLGTGTILSPVELQVLFFLVFRSSLLAIGNFLTHVWISLQLVTRGNSDLSHVAPSSPAPFLWTPAVLASLDSQIHLLNSGWLLSSTWVTVPLLWRRNALQAVIWGNHSSSHLFSITVLYCLISNILTDIVSYILSDFPLIFRGQDKSSSCYLKAKV